MTFEVGSRVLYMKVGTHAREDLASIIARKQAEIEAAGFCFWGYGGNTCHPTSMVRPFAMATPGPIILAMHSMVSNHFAEPVRADEYSTDGITWQPVPEAINVLGSRYALAIDGLEATSETLQLAGTRVAVGNKKGKPGSEYIAGRVDKACLEVASVSAEDGPSVSIDLKARLVDPYAVFLRNLETGSK